MNGDPSMADPNTLLPQEQQPIPQGPTVQATAPSTNSLADLANLVIPGLVGLAGAKYNKQPGLLGFMEGAGRGADAMQAQRANAQKYQAALDERQYKQAVTQQAQENTLRMKMVDQQTQLKIANRDETLKTITDPAEKELYLSNPTQWAKLQMIKESKAGDVAFIVKASHGQLDSADVAAMSDETRHALAIDLAKGVSQNKSYGAVKVPLDPEKGTYTWMIQDQRGNAKFVPGRDIQGGPEEPKEEKGKLTDAQKIKMAQQLGIQWEKNADPASDVMAGRPAGQWAKDHPKEQWIRDQLDVNERVIRKNDKQVDKQIVKDEKQAPEFDFSDGDTKKAFEKIRAKYPDMTADEMVSFYEAHGGKIP